MRFDRLLAVVLAGNDKDPLILGGAGQPSKFFLPFVSGLVGQCILNALDGLGRCRCCYVAVPPDQIGAGCFATECPLYLVPQGPTHTGSMWNALREAEGRGHYAAGDHVLVISGDLPLLSSAALEGFITASERVRDADLYIAMVPFSAVPLDLRQAYRKDVLPFRGGPHLCSNVYLLRPDAVTKAGYARFERLMSIRRLDLTTFHGLLKITAAVVDVVGLWGLLPLIRVARRLGRPNIEEPEAHLQPLDWIERIALDLIEKRFGPRVSFVVPPEPSLALEFDRPEQLELLSAYAGHGSRSYRPRG
ncbi:MAG: hypothetical protein H5T69_08240 [Chloroflexi bacterium]|nr:hypothetical protein [Chloroflexota bacterium]